MPDVLFFALLILTGLRDVARATDLSPSALVAHGLLIGALYGFLLRPRWPLPRRFYRPVLIALLVGITLQAVVVYPYADGQKAWMQGDDRDDALIVAGQRLLVGEHPYAGRTYFGNQQSAGPGWVLLHLPVIASNTYILTTPLLLIAAALWINRRWGAFTALRWVGLLVISTGFWYNLVTGSDFIAIGLCIALLWAAVHSGRYNPTALAILTGLFATARVIFAGLGPLYALLVWQRDRRVAVRFALLSSMTTLATHAAFYLWNPAEYGPAHLFGKSERLLSVPLLIVGALALGLFAIFVLRGYFRHGVHFERGLWVLALLIGLPLLLVSAGDLTRRADVRGWEASDYLVILLPLLALVVARRSTSVHPSSSPPSLVWVTQSHSRPSAHPAGTASAASGHIDP